jgi:hypothetical protein
VPTGTAREELRERLEAVDGVEHAFIEGPPWRAHLVCGSAASKGGPLDAEVGVALALSGFAPGEVAVSVSYAERSETRRRVRFVTSELEHPRVGWAVSRVSIEWNGTTAHGEAEGESNPTYDLRLAAVATVKAIESLVPPAPHFHVVGVKPLRVFDQDLVVVLIRVEGSLDQPLVGSSLVTGGAARSASLAVLNALNRLLGNYLAVSD